MLCGRYNLLDSEMLMTYSLYCPWMHQTGTEDAKANAITASVSICNQKYARNKFKKLPDSDIST